MQSALSSPRPSGTASLGEPGQDRLWLQGEPGQGLASPAPAPVSQTGTRSGTAHRSAGGVSGRAGCERPLRAAVPEMARPPSPPARDGGPHLSLGGELDHRLPEVELGVGAAHGAARLRAGPGRAVPSRRRSSGRR